MCQALVVDADPRRPWLAARSVRSLRAAGIARVAVHQPWAAPPAAGGPCLLVRAGSVLRHPRAFRPPPPAAGGGDLVAVGLPDWREAGDPWNRFQARHGGHCPAAGALPPVLCEWHAAGLTAAARLGGRAPRTAPRVVHWPPLDLAPREERLTVFEVVTSLQHGGAERIACELAAELQRHAVAARLIVLGKPHRRPLEPPPGTIELSHLPRAGRAAHLAGLAVELGADVLHLHLTDAGETGVLAAAGVPVVVTVHNTRPGWPAGWERLPAAGVVLLLACARRVEDELRAALPAIPVRTVWNGIRPNEFPERAAPPAGPPFVLACVANPRPQKRLEWLPEVLAGVRGELARRGVAVPAARLVIAGETAPGLADAVASRAAVDAAADRHGVGADICWTEGRTPVGEVLAGCHALVSCSAHEGLSLAHLEALSTGRPVVALDTGGTRDLAWRMPAVALLAAGAQPADVARATAEVLLDPPASCHRRVWRDFTAERMGARVARFAHLAAAQRAGPARAIWFVTNNLGTGGAQASLRRLAGRLQAGGRRVRVALLQEYPEHPTPGRLDLLGRGVGVFVPPPAGLAGEEQAVGMILAEMAADPPAAVAFWNALARHKLLLADALAFTRVFDVSPGEMFYPPLERALDDPPPALPCRAPRDYGRLLAGVVVKHAAEAGRAAAFGAPVHVIPNGVPPPPHPLRRTPPAGAPLVIGTAARLSPQKRPEDLLDAFRRALPGLPPCVLRIAGGVETGAGEHVAGLRRRAAGLPVEWLGELHDLAGFHRQCDIFAMVSEPAGCPNASLEALAAGLPVVATDVGGAAEQVRDGLTGRLVPPRDAAAFAAALLDLARSPELRATLGDAGREHVLRHFTLDRMLGDYLRLLDPRPGP